MSLLGKPAPRFKAKAVINGSEIVDKFSLTDYIGKKKVVLFFYPADFTFVCPTEILAFQDLKGEFDKRGVEIIGVSVDSEHSHWKWLQTEVINGGIKGVTYPLVSDCSLTISQNYDVLAGDFDYDDEGHISFEGNPQAYRALFVIDQEGIVRHQSINDMSLGRNTEEVVRIIDALSFYEENGNVCPANWHIGDKGVIPTYEGICDYMAAVRANK